MIGQVELLNKIFSIPLNELSHSILLLGELGCGKHTLAKEMSSHYSLSLYDITEDISFESISDIQSSSKVAFYLVDLDNITVKEQNTILKFLEEPSNNVYLILISSTQNILDTIRNRCVIYKFAPYNIDELSAFIEDKENFELFKYCSTPGQILSMNTDNIKNLINLCDNIITNISKASYTNTLSIVNKINFKDEFDKFDLNLFFKIISSKVLEKYIIYHDEKYIESYDLINEYYSKILYLKTNVESIFTSFISKMWRISHNIC